MCFSRGVVDSIRCDRGISRSSLLLEAISFVTGDVGGGSVARGESKECVYCREKCSLAVGHPCFFWFLPDDSKDWERHNFDLFVKEKPTGRHRSPALVQWGIFRAFPIW